MIFKTPFSFRWQLIISVALVHLVMMSVFIFDLVSRERDFLRKLSDDKAFSQLELLSRNSKSWLLSNDIVGLREVLPSIDVENELLYAMILSPEGQVLAHTDETKRDSYLVDAISKAALMSKGAGDTKMRILVDTPEALHLNMPIYANDEIIGWGRLGVSRHLMQQNLELVSSNGIIYTLIAIMLGSLFAIFIANKLVVSVNPLIEAVKMTSQGRSFPPIPISHVAEIETLRIGFIAMIDSLRNEKAAREEAAMKMMQSQEQFELAVRGSQDGIWDWFLRDNRIFFSPRWKDQLGYRDEELPNELETFESRLHPDDRKEVMAFIDSYVRNDISVYSKEFRLRHKDGTYRWILSRGEACRDAQGVPYRLAGSHTDITQRKQAEAVLLKMAADMEKKNAEMESFLYTASHDLKTPLVTIKTFVAFLEQDLTTQDSETIAKDMSFIQGATAKMSQMLDSLLELSRIGKIITHPEQLFFQALMRKVLVILAGRIAQKGVQVIVKSGDVELYGDGNSLEPIWVNLIENACKFMGEQPLPRISVGVETQGEETVFFVRDNGIGISPQHQEIVFRLFERIDKQVEGAGIGLTLVKRIIDNHQGRIWLESEGLGHGSCFYFTLPQAYRR